MATDGTLCTLPAAKPVVEHFGQWHGRQGEPCPKARVSQLYDVLNHITVAALITSKGIGERDHAAAHSLHLGPDDLLLLDRGYECFWLFKLILTSGANVCARVSCNKLKVVKAFLQSGASERIVKLTSTPNSARKCTEFDTVRNPDEKHTRILGDKTYVATTVGSGSILGAAVAKDAGEKALTDAYQTYKHETQCVKPEYSPKTVNMDGWKATRNAWQTLFPAVVIVCCFLHVFIKIRDRSKKKYRGIFEDVASKSWECCHAESKVSFSQKVDRTVSGRA